MKMILIFLVAADKCFPCSNTIFRHSNTFRHLRKINITAAQQNWYVDVCTGQGGRGRSYIGRNGTYNRIITHFTHYNETPDKLTSM